MAAFLLKATHAIALPAEAPPSATEIADWLERTLGSSTVSITRVGDTSLDFRSTFRFTKRDRRNDSLALVAEGEIDVSRTQEGVLLTVRANPYIWETVVPLVGVLWYAGWAATTALLRWGAGLGGVLLGGFFVLLTWSSLKSVLSSIGANLLTALHSRSPDPGTDETRR